jgi:hypothetical protein
LSPQDVTLDIVELIFKEQYLNGYDMLRIKKHMENTCVYLKKNIEFCSMRCTVKEMWAKNGDAVTCGYVGEKTRVNLFDKLYVFFSEMKQSFKTSSSRKKQATPKTIKTITK